MAAKISSLRKCFLQVSFLCMLFVLVPIVAAGSPDAADAGQVLSRFTEARKNLNSCILKGSVTHSYNTTRMGKGVTYSAFDIRYDGDRFKNFCRAWGDINSLERGIKEKDADCHMDLWDGETAYSYDKSVNHNKGRGGVRISEKDKPGKYANRAQEYFKGSSLGLLMGYYDNDKVSIDKLLSGTSVKLQLPDKRSKLGGVDCYVLQADVPKYGKYTVWIDPVHDYHIARIQVQRGPGDRMGSDSNLLILKKGEIKKYSYEVLKFEKYAGAWFPKICKSKKYHTFPGYKSSSELDTTFSEITLNPDHDALGSFLPDDITNESTVRILSLPVKNKFLNRFFWQDGTVVDKEGKKVDLEKIRKEPNKRK